MNQSLILTPSRETDCQDTPQVIDFLQEHYFQGAKIKDVLVITPTEGKSSIGINQVREIKKKLKFATGADQPRLVIIHKAHLLTPEAQNSLLKTLEEPPAHTTIVLQTHRPQALLDTIGSRCRLVRPPAINRAEPQPEAALDLEVAWPKSYTQAIKLANDYKDRQAALKLLQDWLTQTRLPAHTKNLVLKTIKQLQANLNVRLALEQLFFQTLPAKTAQTEPK